MLSIFNVKSIKANTVPIPKISTIGNNDDNITKNIKFFFSLDLIRFQTTVKKEDFIGSFYIKGYSLFLD